MLGSPSPYCRILPKRLLDEYSSNSCQCVTYEGWHTNLLALYEPPSSNRVCLGLKRSGAKNQRVQCRPAKCHSAKCRCSSVPGLGNLPRPRRSHQLHGAGQSATRGEGDCRCTGRPSLATERERVSLLPTFPFLKLDASACRHLSRSGLFCFIELLLCRLWMLLPFCSLFIEATSF